MNRAVKIVALIVLRIINLPHFVVETHTRCLTCNTRAGDLLYYVGLLAGIDYWRTGSPLRFRTVRSSTARVKLVFSLRNERSLLPSYLRMRGNRFLPY